MADERAARGGGRAVAVQPQISVSASFRGEGSWSGAWMGPLDPMTPVAPPEVGGRRLDYATGWNLNPRQARAGGVTFNDLRGLADGYDILRLIIETRKDQLERLKFNIKPRDPKAKVEGNLKARIDAIELFLRRPDRRSPWGSWLRQLLEDLFVLDAPAIFRRRTRGGQLYALELVDGSTVDCLLNAAGRTPEYPDPAYQQRLKGLPAANFTERDLLYRPRNRRTHKVYGYSPVEQIIMTVNIALRRQMYQLSYYTEGNVPEALVGVPETWTPEQIGAFQTAFDAMMIGNSAMRRRMHFIPSSAAKGYTPTKSDQVFGEGEEWLARVCCFAFSISPLPFVKMMNRATSDTSADAATEEGLLPLMGYLKGLIDEVIEDDFASADLEFAWEEESELGPKEQSEVLGSEAADGRITLNEAREAKGLDPYPGEAFNKPMMKTATGWVFVDPDDAIADAKRRQDELGPPPGMPGAEGSDDAPGPKPAGGQGKGPKAGAGAEPGPGEDNDRAGKAAIAPGLVFTPSETPPDQGEGAPNITRPKVRRAEVRLAKAIAGVFSQIADDVAGQVEEGLRLVGKAEGDEPDIDGLLAQLELSAFDAIIDQARSDFFTVADDAGRLALGQIGVTDADDLFEQVNTRAQAFASRRAAELVGRRIRDDGVIVDSSNPAMAITDSTRNMIRQTIEDGITNNLSADAIADQIQTGATFSADRAKLIAHTEIATANSQGALAGYFTARAAGVDVAKAWLVGSKPCEVCSGNAAAGPVELEDEFPSGHTASPAHPRCECAVSPVVRDAEVQPSAGGAS